MSTQDNKELLMSYIDAAWNTDDWSQVEKYVAEDVVFHDQLRDDSLPRGRQGLKLVMDRVRTGMPDFVMNIELVMAEDDLVAMVWNATGTHAGEFNGFPATGRTATLHAISVVRIRDGQIVEGWQEADQLGMGQQMGMVPAGGMPPLMARAMSLKARVQDRFFA